MIAAGINTKALSTYMGHASITITLDRYGHLLPGNEHEAATLLDRWLTSKTTLRKRANAAQQPPP
jgi:integrase